MRRYGDDYIVARRMDESYRRLWRVVVEQALRDAQRLPPASSLVVGSEMENAARKTADILEARTFPMEPQQSEDMHGVLDLASMTGVTQTAHGQRVEAAIDADAANPVRAAGL